MSASSQIFASLSLGGGDLNQHQIAFDVILSTDVVDSNDGNNLLELLADLLQHGIVSDDHEGHSRQMGSSVSPTARLSML